MVPPAGERAPRPPHVPHPTPTQKRGQAVRGGTRWEHFFVTWDSQNNKPGVGDFSCFRQGVQRKHFFVTWDSQTHKACVGEFLCFRQGVRRKHFFATLDSQNHKPGVFFSCYRQGSSKKINLPIFRIFSWKSVGKKFICDFFYRKNIIYMLICINYIKLICINYIYVNLYKLYKVNLYKLYKKLICEINLYKKKSKHLPSVFATCPSIMKTNISIKCRDEKYFYCTG